jgi:hypothetical protein
MIRVTRIVINRPAISRTIKRQVNPQIEDGLVALRGIFSEQFGGVKTGRMYRRPGGGFRQASAAGESPARQSGELERSISNPIFPALNIGQLRITARYARGLDRGTARVAARPFVHPAVLTLIRRWKGGKL